LPTLARTVPDGPQWAHEIKHDGYRMVCRRGGDRVRVFTRRGHDWADRMPVIAEGLLRPQPWIGRRSCRSTCCAASDGVTCYANQPAER
jgi:hypothetical protein